MTPDERKVWLDSLKPGDEVVYSERTADSLSQLVTRAKVVAVHQDCFIVDRYIVARLGKSVSACRGVIRQIDPMTDEARQRFADDDRRDWIKANIRGQVNNLGSEDLRRVSELLGYKDPTE